MELFSSQVCIEAYLNFLPDSWTGRASVLDFMYKYLWKADASWLAPYFAWKCEQLVFWIWEVVPGSL